jgi:hypothetical protein
VNWYAIADLGLLVLVVTTIVLGSSPAADARAPVEAHSSLVLPASSR